ncbi:MAG TPA: asparagine synthetase B, partial [Nitrospirae bacterium]|nr:asparagine synthetase B [Nitrospirota bacterium]
MCGIAGFIDATCNIPSDEMAGRARKMARAIKYRGPDDEGVWVDETAGVAFGHRRLSILDLSDKGRQPMISANGRYVIAYNGEIYNHISIRKALDKDHYGIRWRGHSDTEALLEAIDKWGMEKTLNEINGMFSFALWDRKEKSVTFARDRIGKKPLYYGWVSKTLVFGSELKAIQKYPGFHSDVNRDSLALLLRHNYIPSPYSIYENIYKLPPGTIMTFRRDQLINLENFSPAPVDGGQTALSPKRYWSAKTVLEQGSKNRFAGTELEALDELDKLLGDAVKLRMVADVPVGAFLSGGID